MEKTVVLKLREIQSSIEEQSKKIQELETEKTNMLDSVKNLQGEYKAYYDMANNLGLVDGNNITEKGNAIIQELEAGQPQDEPEVVEAEEVTE